MLSGWCLAVARRTGGLCVGRGRPLRRITFRHVRLRGEGSIPVPLPPPLKTSKILNRINYLESEALGPRISPQALLLFRPSTHRIARLVNRLA